MGKAALRNIIALSVSLHLLACAGRVANHLPPGDESLAEAERLEKQGAFEEASELYLECFASTSCNEGARLTVSTDLKRIADEAPSLEPSIWRAVATAEGRVSNASSVTEALTGDLASLIGIYHVWKQPERGLKLLQRLHGAQRAV